MIWVELNLLFQTRAFCCSIIPPNRWVCAKPRVGMKWKMPLIKFELIELIVLLVLIDCVDSVDYVIELIVLLSWFCYWVGCTRVWIFCYQSMDFYFCFMFIRTIVNQSMKFLLWFSAHVRRWATNGDIFYQCTAREEYTASELWSVVDRWQDTVQIFQYFLLVWNI